MIKPHAYISDDIERLKCESEKDKAYAMLLNSQARLFETIVRLSNDKRMRKVAAEITDLKSLGEPVAPKLRIVK